MNKPHYVFKFKSLTTENLPYSLDVIDNHRLYLSTRSELNDPMEGGIGLVSLAIPSSGIYESVGVPHPIVIEQMDKYRILSLTSSFDSPQMWAHYAANYSGLCFIFSTRDSLSSIRNVNYTNKKFRFTEQDLAQAHIGLDQYIENAYYYKSQGWEYENEWRVTRLTSEKYLPFAPDELCGVILGHNNVSCDLQGKIIEACTQKEIPVYQTFTSIYGYSVDVAPLGFCLDGSSNKISTQIAEAYLRQGHIPDFLTNHYSI